MCPWSPELALIPDPIIHTALLFFVAREPDKLEPCCTPGRDDLLLINH